MGPPPHSQFRYERSSSGGILDQQRLHSYDIEAHALSELAEDSEEEEDEDDSGSGLKRTSFEDHANGRGLGIRQPPRPPAVSSEEGSSYFPPRRGQTRSGQGAGAETELVDLSGGQHKAFEAVKR